MTPTLGAAAHERLPVAAPVRPHPLWRLAALGLAIGGAYYVGTAVGLALKLPSATPSVMWPPNAILTSALLLTPPRFWAVALLSALPAHVWLESAMGWPIPLVLALFATNCSEALIAAGGLRWLSDAPTRLDSLRRVSAFLGVVVIAAPVISSYFDAAVVSWVVGESYWQVWSARLFSNALTAITVVPAVVTVATSWRRWLKHAPRSRHVEAALLAASMLLTGAFLLGHPIPNSMATVLAERAAVAWLLPFLLWAAIRLGPGGVSLALLGAALFLISAAVHSHGPFQGLSPSGTTLALQIFMIALSMPLLVVAALIEERRVAQQDISNRLALEALLARLSGAFVRLPGHRAREVFHDSLRHVGEFLSLDAVVLFEVADPTSGPAQVASWTAPGREAVPELSLRRYLAFSSSTGAEHDFPGGVAIPLNGEAGMLGILAVLSSTPLAPLQSQQLRTIARLLTHALDRKSREDSLRASEATKSAILSSLTAAVVVIDRLGQIITVNERWRQVLEACALPATLDVGANYLEFVRETARSGELWAAEVANGITAILLGRSQDFRLEYVQPCRDGTRTLVIRAVPLDREGGGAVVTYADITDQRRAELEAQQARAELAHVSRVATMGALTASIAHQLNQPLTGILLNAQAARRFLSTASPDLHEVTTSLEHIIEDDRRASDVIVRMRDFLRKDDGQLEDIDLNALVGGVTRLVSSDAVFRNVALLLQLDVRPAVVRGDRVQLQQVVLNLIVNALEAFVERSSGDRRIVVRSGRPVPGFVEISVDDNASAFMGTPDGAFDAFYTTKPGGMGLGLSIARSIVEAHAGVIRAANKSEGGATVAFRLPLSSHAVR